MCSSVAICGNATRRSQRGAASVDAPRPTPRDGAGPARAIRVPNTWLLLGYSLVFAAFARILGLSFADLSPIRVDPSLDPRLLRFGVLQAQSKDAEVRLEASPSGVRVQASGLRSPGLTIAIESPLIETPCALGQPHAHAAGQGEEALEVRFEAQALEPNTRLQLGIAEPAPDRVPRRLRWVKPLELDDGWRAFRVPLADMRPPARSDARAGAVAAILLRPFPPAHSALVFRHVTLLRVASTSGEPRFLE
jgi:hypothetical protein